MQAAAREQLRQQYLAAMGVTPWLPRQPLPGAAPSPVWQWQTAPAAASVEPSATTSQVAAATEPAPRRDPSRSSAPLRQMLQQPENEAKAAAPESAVPASVPPSKPTAKPAVPPETVVSTPAVAPAVVPQLHLMLLAYPDCLVVTDLPLSQVWSESHQRLLAQILASVGLGGDACESSQFRWPMDPSAQYDQSETVARRALQMMLEPLTRPEQRQWLLMGQRAIEYLAPTPDIEPGALIEQDQRRLLCCPGLHEMLRLPELKAELWRQLQPLRPSRRDG